MQSTDTNTQLFKLKELLYLLGITLKFFTEILKFFSSRKAEKCCDELRTIIDSLDKAVVNWVV